MTLIYTHDAFGRHRTPDGHAERPARYDAVLCGLGGDLADLERCEAPIAARQAVLRAHPERYLDALKAAEPGDGLVQLDPDTWMGPSSLEAADRATGACIAAVDALVAGAAATAFVASRPPGHHAERDKAMGFCLLSHAAIAALHARDAHGLSRVAVVDFDVHHGNGTQDVLWDEPGCFYASSHEWPLYPGTGKPSERGERGTIRNATLAAGEGGDAFRRVWAETLLPELDAFAPELVLVSAGFDAHAADPLANIKLVEDDFAWITQEILSVASAHAKGRVVSVLEGGYDLEALERSVAAHVSALSR